MAYEILLLVLFNGLAPNKVQAIIWTNEIYWYIDGLVQERRNFSALKWS